MEFLDLLFPVLISIFAFVLQQREDEVIDSALSRRIVLANPAAYGVPKSSLQPTSSVFAGQVMVFSSTASPAVRQQGAPV
jgi:hypothetical protein